MNADQESDLAFIKNRMDWPRWPTLPIKRYRDGQIEAAMLYASEPLRLIRANPWHEEAVQAAWSKAEAVTAEQIIADGWEVD